MKTWTHQNVKYRLMTDKEFQRALEDIAYEITEYGYECTGISAELECIDVWGFEWRGKNKRRTRCFLEIYATRGIIEVETGYITSIVFSHPDYNVEDCIEVLFDRDGIPDVSDLVTGITEVIEPIKGKRK